MPLLSVITAAYGPSANFLPETIASVLSQELPDNWEIEYLIQEDGAVPVLQELQSKDSRVKYSANGDQLGVAVTRNMALNRAQGELTQLIDHDDLLLPQAFTALVPRFLEHQIHWAIGQADDLMPDGSRRAYPAALPFGVTRPGTVNDWATEHEGNWPVHCAAMMARTTTLRALGGWAATPSDDDIALFSALFELTPGFQEEALTWLYRQHDAQTHRSPQWKHQSQNGRQFAIQRINAIRTTGLSIQPSGLTAPRNTAVAAPIKG